MTQAPLFSLPPKLTDRQQLVYDLVGSEGLVSARTAGLVLHYHRGCIDCVTGQCEYAEPNGREVLEALRRKGLVRKDRRWLYRRVDERGSQGQLPESF